MTTLGKRVASGALWVTVGSVAQQAINFAMFVYLAQALEPVTFGVMALGMVLVETFMVLGKLGQSDWLLHKKELSEEESSTSFWLLMISGGVGGAAIWALAAPAAWLFGEPEVAGVMMALAPICLITNLAGVHEARLRRAFKFRGVAMRQTFGSMLSAVVALIAMAMDAGLYTLVAQKIALISGIAAATLFLDPWRPKLHFDPAQARGLASNGVRISSGLLTHQLTPRIVDGIVGGFLGAVALGYLRIAWQLSYFVLNLFIYPVVNVASSAFGRLKEDPQAMSATFRSMVQGVLLVLAPAAIGLMTVAPLFIPALLGEKWEPSVVVIQLTCLTFFTEVPCYLAAGRADRRGAQQRHPVLWVAAGGVLRGLRHRLRALRHRGGRLRLCAALHLPSRRRLLLPQHCLPPEPPRTGPGRGPADYGRGADGRGGLVAASEPDGCRDGPGLEACDPDLRRRRVLFRLPRPGRRRAAVARLSARAFRQS